MATELRVASNPFVLYRCGICNSRRWMSDGHIVAFGEVAAAMAKDSAHRGSSRQRPRGVKAEVVQTMKRM